MTAVDYHDTCTGKVPLPPVCASRPPIAQCLSSQLAPREHRKHLWGGGVKAREVERV